MHAITTSFRLARVMTLCLAINCTASLELAKAQSPIVFMTGNPGPSLLSNSRLLRLDNGTQTFSVNHGQSGAYVGTTIWNGQVLVADVDNGDIQRFSPDGTFLGTFGMPLNPAAFFPSFVESDLGGNVYTTLAQTAPLFADVAIRFNSAGIQTGTFEATEGIDADAIGNVYAVFNNELRKYAPGGPLLNSTPVAGTAWDLSIDEAGSRLFLANSTSVEIFDISGISPVLTGSIAAPPQADFTGVHYAPESGNVLVTDLGLFSNDARGLEYTTGGLLLDEYFPVGVDFAWDIASMVPEAGSLTLLCIGLAGFAASRRAVRR